MDESENDSNFSMITSLLGHLELDEEGLQRFTAMLETEDGQDRFEQAFRTAIDEGAVAVAAELKRTARVALADHRSIRKGFEARLRRRWKKALDIFEMLLIAAPEGGSDLSERYGDRAVSENDLTFEALKLLHGRACVTASEVRALLVSGHPTGAHARWRTLHELAVITSVIKDHGADLAERYLLHEHIEAWNDLKVYQEHCTVLQEEPFSDEDCQAIQATYQALIAKYGKPYGTQWGWAAHLLNKSNPGLGDLEQLAGLAHLRPYYRLSTKGVHATSRSVSLNVVRQGRGRVMLAGATNAGLAEAGQGALISLIQVTTSLLVYGFEKLGDPTLLITCGAFRNLLDEANHQFASTELRLRQEDEDFWASQEDS